MSHLFIHLVAISGFILSHECTMEIVLHLLKATSNKRFERVFIKKIITKVYDDNKKKWNIKVMVTETMSWTNWFTKYKIL